MPPALSRATTLYPTKQGKAWIKKACGRPHSPVATEKGPRSVQTKNKAGRIL